jgi:hypothetical protein
MGVDDLAGLDLERWFKKKCCDTLFKGMKVMILKGPADRHLQVVGLIVGVMM